MSGAAKFFVDRRCCTLRRACLLLCLAATALLSACSSTRPWVNPPLQAAEKVRYDGRAQFVDPARAQDLLVVASFSGGGSRAASFAHATIAELDRLTFRWGEQETSLAQQIDMVAGVSGGSVAAAHLALHGVNDHIARFPADFLTVDFESRLIGAALHPANAYRMTSPWMGRGNLLADEFDALLFGGTTFGRLGEMPGRPYLIVGATDLSNGAEFDFASDQLLMLCSSIDLVPLAFAVAASSSVPLVFSPLSLQNHSRTCPASSETQPRSAPVTSGTARARLVQSEFDSYAEVGKRFVHLVDGGLSDNLGLRRISDYVVQAGGVRPVLALLQGDAKGSLPRRIVFVSVNSERRGPPLLDQMAEVPNTLDVLGAMIYGGLGRYSRETSLTFAAAVEDWRRELQSGGTTSDVDIFSIEVNLSDVDDRELRDKVLAISTSFRISDEDRSLLQNAARVSLERNPELRRFLESTMLR
jgi:NTE family protein